MYLNTKIISLEYMKIHVGMIPQEFMEEYDVTQYLDDKGYTYVQITGEIYGLIKLG